jgi:hypothetical protein
MALYRQELPAPYRPGLASPFDTQHYDNYEETPLATSDQELHADTFAAF